MEDNRIVYVSIDGDVLSFEIDKPADIDEDTFYESVCNYIFENIQIEII